MPSQQHLSYRYMKVLCSVISVMSNPHIINCNVHTKLKRNANIKESNTQVTKKNSVIVCKLNAVNCNALFSLLTHIFVWKADGHTCTGGCNVTMSNITCCS